MKTSFEEFLVETENSATESFPCALGVRARLARNLAGTPFPCRANAATRRAVAEKIAAAAESVPEFRDGFLFDVESLSATRRKYLVERRLISSDLGGVVLISRSRDVSLMINEEDHLRLQVFSAGDDSGAAWARARELDKALAERLDFAFSEKYGFLTSCPTNAGTGLRISVMLHLPGFVTEGLTEKILRALGAVGLTARGCFGEGSEPRGCVFQISNEHTLGISEAETLALLRRWTREVVDQELAARRRVLSRERALLADRIGRAYGSLRFAVSLAEDESAELLSLLRMACDAGFFPPSARERFDELWFETGPAHIACRAALRGTLCDDEARENLLRARLFRETLSAVPPPDFPNFLK